MNHGTYIVTWTTTDKSSDWAAHETRAAAEAQYKLLLADPSTYTASLCCVLESTDYTPIRPAAILGAARSEAKAATARLNGFAPCRKGRKRGRPRTRPLK